jgi:hypothetical protein
MSEGIRIAGGWSTPNAASFSHSRGQIEADMVRALRNPQRMV